MSESAEVAESTGQDDDYIALRDGGSDAVMVRTGEGGVPMMALLTKVATFESTID